MNAETQAVLFNAVPLLLLAALYLAVGAALAPASGGSEAARDEIGFATALVFPCVGLAAAVLGHRRPSSPASRWPGTSFVALAGDPARRAAGRRGRCEAGTTGTCS